MLTNSRSRTSHFVLACIPLAVSCASTADDDAPRDAKARDFGAFSARHFELCDSVLDAEDEAPTNGPDAYDFVALTKELEADPALREETGLDTVDSCSNARKVARTRRALQEQAMPEPAEETAAQSANSDKIKLGVDGIARGSIGIEIEGHGFCSGSLISQSSLLTAAHCINRSIPLISGMVRIRVRYRSPTDGVLRLANFGDANSFTNAIVKIHPDFTDKFDNDDDVAVLTLQSGSWATAGGTADLMPIAIPALNTSSSIRIHGYGITGDSRNDSGIARFPEGNGSKTVEFVSPTGKYFIINATQGWGTCSGDSGGPALLGSNVAGVYSNSDTSSGQVEGSFCSQKGKKIRWTTLSPKIDFIDSRVPEICRRDSIAMRCF